MFFTCSFMPKGFAFSTHVFLFYLVSNVTKDSLIRCHQHKSNMALFLCVPHIYYQTEKKKRIKYFSIKKCILFMVSIHFRWEIPLNFKTSVTNAEIKFTFWLPKQFRLHFRCMCVSLFRKTHFLHLLFRKTRSHTNACNKQRKTSCFWPGAIFKKWSNFSQLPFIS